MTPERLDEIEARAKAATEGPWESDRYCLYIWGKDSAMVADSRVDEAHLEVAHDPIIRARGVGGKLPIDENMKFIAHSRHDVPDLIAEVRRLRDDYAKIRAIAEEQGAALNSLVDIEEECGRLRAALTGARSEMRERAAKMTEGWIGAIPKDIAFSIRLLPLDPDGEMT